MSSPDEPRCDCEYCELQRAALGLIDDAGITVRAYDWVEDR